MLHLLGMLDVFSFYGYQKSLQGRLLADRFFFFKIFFRYKKTEKLTVSLERVSNRATTFYEISRDGAVCNYLGTKA